VLTLLNFHKYRSKSHPWCGTIALNTFNIPQSDMVHDEETAEWRGDGVSVGFDASAEYHHVEQLKRKLVQLSARVEALREAEEKMASEREGVEAEMAKVESELEAAVAAPTSGGRDPTSWLPDELLIVILLLLPSETLWKGQCTAVCRRWRTGGEWASATTEADRAVGGIRQGVESTAHA
jgi:hypothetical protein